MLMMDRHTRGRVVFVVVFKLVNVTSAGPSFAQGGARLFFSAPNAPSYMAPGATAPLYPWAGAEHEFRTLYQ
ncbi:hypothetical protein EVAR_80642_1 [Eumeta japonica]|uniref:Secreted protein n=1 Tax=Eumeta variegata TaxID=151549 RepID=A0A4C1YUP7_EUMVA|nr:hypothetical protein EVAR_80642_1 [Eumeta japonica]